MRWLFFGYFIKQPSVKYYCYYQWYKNRKPKKETKTELWANVLVFVVLCLLVSNCTKNLEKEAKISNAKTAHLKYQKY